MMIMMWGLMSSDVGLEYYGHAVRDLKLTVIGERGVWGGGELLPGCNAGHHVPDGIRAPATGKQFAINK